MKRLYIPIILVMLLTNVAYGGPEEVLEKVTLKIEGMTTACCIPRVEEALLKVKGVKKVSVCIKRGIAEVEIEAGQVTTEQLINAVEKAGFKASVEEMEKKEEMSQLQNKFTELSIMYNLVKEEIVEHWNSVKEVAKEIYEACCKWSLSRGMEINDAEDYCKSAMLSGMDEKSLAEKIFCPKTGISKLNEKYKIPEKDLREHWNFVKEKTKKSYGICYEWALSRGMKIEDAESYCKSAILSGMGETALAEQIFKKEVRKLTDYEIKDLSKDRYGRFAEKYAETGNPCPIRKKQVGELYSEQEFSLVSKTARNLALGCGNPVRFANLKPGEIVVDLGSGAGIDVILAAHKVGPSGRVIGVDITPQMIEKAKQAVAEAGLEDRRIELYVGDIEKLQLPDSFADVVISNCVIILVPNKEKVYKEAFRILKPGGRIAISDIVFSEKICPKMKARFESIWSGVVGGAIDEKDYLEIVNRIGFKKIEIVERHFLTPEELMAMSSCPGTEFAPNPDEKDIEAVQGKVVSIKFTAIKP
ncbi:MAG: methyltransferase domain-containing protein [Candidatus Omnitrophica bacterium]|nr:methyltransferase domain-containing protein [Candidatus Omnitrophota bacterium]